MRPTFTISLLLILLNSFGQQDRNTFVYDPQWTLLNLNQLFKNPAFTGEAGDQRLVFISRSQWINLDSFNSFALSFDSPLLNRSSVGILSFADYQPSGIKQTSILGYYAIQFPEETKVKKMAFQLGLKAGFANLGFADFSDKIFADQLSPSSTSILINNSLDNLKNSNLPISQRTFDSGTGMVLKYLPRKEKEYPLHLIGFSLDHFQSLLGKNIFFRPRLGIQYSRHVDYTKRIFPRARASELSISPSKEFSINYYSQYRSHQVQILQEYHSYPLHWGYGFRYNFNQFFKKQNSESILLILGYQWKGIGFLYGFDLTFNSLNIVSTFGSHEISILYHFDSDITLGANAERKKKLKCWDFK